MKTTHQFAAELLAGPDLEIEGYEDQVFRYDVSPYLKGSKPTKLVSDTDYYGFDSVELLTRIGKVPVYLGKHLSTGTTEYVLESFDNRDVWLTAEIYYNGNGKEVFGFDPDICSCDYSERTISKINQFIRAHKNLHS